MRAMLTLIALISLPAYAAQSIPKLTYYTEEYRPLSYTDERGRVTGLSVELLRLMWKEIGAEPQPILVQHWARAYRETLQQDNKVLFATSRTSEREKLFKWVCAISPNRQVVFSLTSANIKIKRADELNRYTIGTVRDDVSEQIVREIGVHHYNVKSVTSFEQNVKKLAANRVDLIAYGEEAARGAIRHMGHKPGDYKVVYVMRETPNCYAFSRRTDDAVIARFQMALDKVKTGPAYQELVKKFGLD